MNGRAKMRPVGVLGGMGPEATILLMSRVVAFTPARDDSDHVPMLVDNNTQVPSRIKALIERTGEDPGPVLVAMARRLAAAGVEALAMPCNTAHHYAPLLKAAVSIPLLDMVELTVDRVARMGRGSNTRQARRIGMLASPAVRITGLFDRAFAARGLEPVYPPHQDLVLSCIKMIKATGRSDAANEKLRAAAAELRAEGVDMLMIACSELSLINDCLSREFPFIDTIDVLAEAVIAFSRDGATEAVAMGSEQAAPTTGYGRSDASTEEGRSRLREEL